MPFDLASLSYGPLSRFKELASPFELGNLKRLGLQHSITKTIPKYTIPHYVVDFNFIGPQHVQLKYCQDEAHALYKTATLTRESCHAFLLIEPKICPPNVEAIDPAIASQIVMQPKIVVLEDFTFQKSNFIFSHPCRRFVTEVELRMLNDYTFTGGEFDLIFETFPNLEKLKLDGNCELSGWIDVLIDSHFGHLPKLFILYNEKAISSIEGYSSKLTELFEVSFLGLNLFIKELLQKSGQKLTLSLKFQKPVASVFVSEMQRLGFSVELWSSYAKFDSLEVEIKIRKENCSHNVLKVDTYTTVYLDDFSMLEFENQKIDDYILIPPETTAVHDFEPPEVIFSDGDLYLTKANIKSKTDRRLFSKSLQFKPNSLTIQECNIDVELLEFTKPFCRHVKTLAFDNVHQPTKSSISDLINTFPNIEVVCVHDLSEEYLCNAVLKLQRFEFYVLSSEFLEFIRANTDKIKNILEQAPSSFCLAMYCMDKLDELEEIRKLGFRVDTNWFCVGIYNGFSRHIRAIPEKETTKLLLSPDEIRLDGMVTITADSPQVEVTAERVILTIGNNLSSFKVKTDVRNKLHLHPTIVIVTSCIDDDFFEFVAGFSHFVKYVDLRECRCCNPHSETQKERIRNAFSNLVLVWDVSDE